MGFTKGKPGWRSSEPEYNAVNNLTVGLYTHDGIVLGSGKETEHLIVRNANRPCMSFYFSTQAQSGTTTACYIRLNTAGSASSRVMSVYNNITKTPSETASCDGLHATLAIQQTADITAVGNAVNAVLHIPDKRITGAVAGVNAEITSSATGGSSVQLDNAAFVRCRLSGNTTVKERIDQYAHLLIIEGGNNASGNIVSAAGNEPAWTGKTHRIRIKANGLTLYLVAVEA